jgi:diguanylate cyclase (GGDEF)-like protein
MRIVGRHDIYWLSVTAVAAFAIFSRPLGRAIDYARDVDQGRGVQLLPALVILAVAFVFHQFRKRHEMHAHALAAESEARQATMRAKEMERMVAFGHALARSLERESIQAAALEHLSNLADRPAWVMIRTSSEWQTFASPDGVHSHDRERAAQRALGDADPVLGSASDVCFPMIVAGRPVGVLGVTADPPLTEHQRSVLTAAAALLAVSLKNAELFHEVHENSVRDSLTGCFNRKHATQVMDGELRRARRSQLPLSLLMFDLDHFKSINDRHGHLCGDAVLAAVGMRMHAVLRGSDLKCRWGGEEFLVLLPDTPIVGARRVAETLRREIEDHPVRWNDELVNVTASVGVTAIIPGEIDIKNIIGRADAALYRAKGAGRNCVRAADEREVLSDAVLCDAQLA